MTTSPNLYGTDVCQFQLWVCFEQDNYCIPKISVCYFKSPILSAQ